MPQYVRMFHRTQLTRLDADVSDQASEQRTSDMHHSIPNTDRESFTCIHEAGKVVNFEYFLL